MNLNEILNSKWLDPASLSRQYSNEIPFPHLVMEQFLTEELAESIEKEFPDLSNIKGNEIIKFDTAHELKFASQGMKLMSPNAVKLISYLHSDLFLKWLNVVTGISEPLISDPYLSGGGYHAIKQGGVLKIHTDFNKHPKFNLDRRLNLLIYLNKNWNDEWGGDLQLYYKNTQGDKKSIFPHFNTAVLFTTTKYTFHGHPDELRCPSDRTRKSIALYFFTVPPRQNEEVEITSTLFIDRKGETLRNAFNLKRIIVQITPPFIVNLGKRIFK